MPTLTIQGHGSHEVAAGTRLVLAIERAGVDIGHRCGGQSRCTTCRVRFIHGAPPGMTRAERDKLEERGLLGQVRLSCQIAVDRDMELAVELRVSEQGWPDGGPAPAEGIEPAPLEA